MNYTLLNHQTWSYLMKRQKNVLKNYAVPEFFTVLDRLQLDETKIPSLNQVENKLKIYSNWNLEPVNEIVPPFEYFSMLSNKTLPVILEIRPFEQVDYYTNDAPDIFHELFGHCPFLTDSAYANFLYEFGKLAISYGDRYISFFQNIFWYTIEFGLIETKQNRYAYGAGILPSYTELQYCFSNKPTVKKLNVLEVLPSDYAGNKLQNIYYTIESFEELYSFIDLLTASLK